MFGYNYLFEPDLKCQILAITFLRNFRWHRVIRRHLNRN